MNGTAIPELPWVYAGIASFAAATAAAMRGVARGGAHESLVLGLCAAGVLLLAVALGERWLRIGHGPFVGLFELIVSQMFSLGLIALLVYWRWPTLRQSAAVALPVLCILSVWALVVDPSGNPYPPTYHNPWLWAHVGFGKVFLALCLVAAGIAGVVLLRATRRGAAWFHHMPADAALDSIAWRLMLVAFVFESMMLIAGAVWAQDAWGRYWSWDPLETSSFLNWILLGTALHARLSYKVPVRAAAAAIAALFVFAFLNYFGVPFLSAAPHKGVV